MPSNNSSTVKLRLVQQRKEQTHPHLTYPCFVFGQVHPKLCWPSSQDYPAKEGMGNNLDSTRRELLLLLLLAGELNHFLHEP